jgi:signal transduction histidine kinase
MDNAVRHNPPSTLIVVTAKPADGHAVTITVADDGIGLPQSLEEHIDRANGRRSATAGAGLGLSISRAIVAAHGGTLRLDRPERGTRWHIDLPFGGADAESEPSPLVTTDG